MNKGRDRTVYRRGDNKWVNKRNDSDRASSLHDTQRDANRAARDMLRNQGGGEVTTKGERSVVVLRLKRNSTCLIAL